jgi:ABC-2 type transport system ATP-binding protein
MRLAATYLRRFGIPEDARGGELSGGQRAQVSLALAIGTTAPVLLMDEPLASLDPLARREFLQVLAETTAKSGVVATLSSHVVSDIEAVCQRLIVLGDGQLLLHDSIARLIQNHRVGEAADAEGWQLVAAFPGEQGRVQHLWKARDGEPSVGPDLNTPTLEDIVVGYLSISRRTSSAL